MKKEKPKHMYKYLGINLIIAIWIIGLLMYIKPVKIANEYYNKKSEYIDLSNTSLIEINECLQKFKYFTNLKVVNFGDNVITLEEKNKLILAYPNIEFKVISTINISNEEFREDLEIINLNNLPKDELLIKKLEFFTNLKEVIIETQELTKEEKMELITTYPNVFFKYNIKLFNIELSSDLEKLNLSNQKDISFQELHDAIKLLPKLKSIDLSNTNLSNEEAAQLREDYPNIKFDWIIHLNNKWSLRTDAVAFSVLITNFNYKRMTSNDIQVLKYCTNLKALDLGHQDITDISVIGDYLPELRVLILADNKISNLTPLAKLKHLHYLELFMNNITDLTPLAECTEMVDLNVCHNYRLSNITPILNYTKLERLWISSCKISQSDYSLLKQKYPNIQMVIKDNYTSTGSGWRTHTRYYTMINMFYNNYMSEEFEKYDDEYK